MTSLHVTVVNFLRPSRNTKLFVDNNEGLRIMTGSEPRRTPMPRKTSPPRPTDGELAILQVLWQQGPSTVRQVQTVLNRRKRTGYTTVLKLMQIMAAKGLLARTKASGATSIGRRSPPTRPSGSWSPT